MTIARRNLLVEGLEEHLKVVKQLELSLAALSCCGPYVPYTSDTSCFGAVTEEVLRTVNI